MYSKLLDRWILSLLIVSMTSDVRADWWTKTKRDLPADSGGIVIPLETDALGRYVTSVGMGNQDKPGPIQNLSFVLSTSSPNCAVAGVKCTTCVSQIGSSSLYNASLSQTEVPLNGTKSFALGQGAVKGSTISETCAFRQSNGSFWWYPNQTVIVANQSTGFFANGAAGLIGLGRSGGDASFISTVFRAHGAWENLTIGLALNGAGAPQAGVMDLRATDSSYYDGDIKYAPVVAAPADVPANYPADWSLHLDSWTVDTGAIRTEHTTGGVAIVEPYFPEIRFPQDQAYLFYRDVPGAVLLNESTGLVWSIPCNPTLSLDVIFSGTPFSIGSDQLVAGDVNSGNCTGVVMGWDNPFVQSYMLGQAFAETVYIVYNANRNGTGDTLGFAPRAGSSLSDSKLSAGTVAGISVGATIAFFLLLIILFLWWRHKRAVRIMSTTPDKEGEGQHKIEPYTPTSSSTPMFNVNTARPDRRPYVIEQGPIGGEVGQTTGLLSSTTPDASPSTAAMSPSHRRKVEEAGFLAHNGRGSIASRGRPSSSQTATTSTDFLQNLSTIPTTPPSPDVRYLSAIPSSPGGAVGGLNAPPPPTTNLTATNPDPTLGRHVSSDTRNHSPLSPQIHYHIHVTPDAAAAGGFLPGNIPPGSIIREYDNDEPAPEYSERPGSGTSSGSDQVPPPTTTTQHLIP